MERLQERPRVALAEEAARVRDAEAFARRVLEPCEVVEIAAVRDDAHALRARRARAPPRRSPPRRSDRVRAARDELRHLLVRGLASPRRRRVVPSVLVRDDRVAKIGDPAGAGRTLDGGADEVDRRRRRRRDHRVDALAACDPDRGRDRRQVPGHARVGEQEASGRDARLEDGALEAGGRAELLGRLSRLRAEVARAVDPGLRRHAELGIPVDPLGIVRGEDVRLDAERRQVLRELERALHAAAAGGREVHRHEQHLHGREG